MPSPEQLEVYRQHSAASDKYVYFLLAAVGAAIALAVNQTQSSELSYSQFPLGIAVTLWALSFYLGCRHLTSVQGTLHANGLLLRVLDGDDPLAGNHPQAMAIAAQVARELIEERSSESAAAAKWQFRCFVLGSCAYLSWHVYEMWLRSV